MISLVLTLIGPDRPGMVERVAAVVREHRGNWLESRMAHLAGQFAGVVRVEVRQSEADALAHALAQLTAEGIDVVTRQDTGGHGDANFPLMSLELIGNDQPGIVSEVSRVFAVHRVNVERFETDAFEAANSGQKMFKASAQLRLPDELSSDQLQAALESIALDLMVEIELAADQPNSFGT